MTAASTDGKMEVVFWFVFKCMQIECPLVPSELRQAKG